MDKNDALEYLNQAKVFLGQSSFENAIEALDKALEIDKMDIETYIYKSIALSNLEKYEEANEELSKALMLDSTNGEVYFYIGNNEILMGNKQKGIENYNKAIANGFDSAQIFVNLGMMYEEEDNIDLALRNYTKAIIKDPLRSDARVRKTEIYISQRKFPEAIQTLDELILADPDLFDGYHLKALLLAENGKTDEGLQVINDAISLFPEDTNFALDKVNILVIAKKPDEARSEVEYIKNNYTLDNYQNRQLMLEESRLYALENDLNKVISCLEKARDYLKAEDSSLLDTEATFLLVNCYIEKEMYSNAAEASQLLIDYGDMQYSIPSYYTLGVAYKKNGETEKAEEAFKDAVSVLRSISLKDPSIADTYVFRALSLKEIKEFDKALELADYLIKLDDKSANFHSVRASILEEMGREEEAQNERAIADSLQ